MKITLETTVYKPATKVEISTDYDDLPIMDVWWQIVRPALVAFGYSETTVDEMAWEAGQFENTKN